MSKIVFKINGIDFEVDGRYGPDVSLNEFLRNVAELRGVKAMCHEGGCGACVVAVRNNNRTFAVNSCLVSVLSCHEWAITTVEGIGSRSTGYHDIQMRLASFNGTQCGFCTSGWVMSMYSLYESKNKNMTMKEIENSFASNLCRCTGYRPIADAFKSFAKDADKNLIDKIADIEDLGGFSKCNKTCSAIVKEQEDNVEEWCVIKDTIEDMIVIDCGDHKWYRANHLEDVFKVIAYGDYRLIAGNTGQGVYRPTDYPTNIIDIRNVSELRGYAMDENIVLGAGMTLSEMMDTFQGISATNEKFFYLKEFYEHLDLVAHIPIKNIGTIGGNLLLKHANNEFPSDLFLIFETVGAMVTIANSVSMNKTISLTEFLATDMNGLVLINVLLPPLSMLHHIKTYKVMPRSQNAHAIVNAGFNLKFHHNNLLESATIVYGGISPSFIHANQTEQLLVGKDPFTDDVLQLTLKSLSDEIVAVDLPPEPSAEYRKRLALALYYKAILSLSPADRVNTIYSSGSTLIKRETSKGIQVYDTDKSIWPLNQPIPKLEALVQCNGQAVFSGDLPSLTNEVHCAFVKADVMPGSIISGFNTEDAFKIPGVIAFYSAKDIPGVNTFTPTDMPFMTADEEILCPEEVKYFGQPAGIIVADNFKTAEKAAKAVKIDYASINSNKALTTIEDVLQSPYKERIVNNQIIEPTDRGNDVQNKVTGEFRIHGQYHFTFETQTCLVRPTEEGMEVYSATQWIDLTSAAISKCLKIPVNSINVIVRRVGGAYGGKISRATQVACSAALVSHLLGRPSRFVLPLETNMQVMGKRLPLLSKFDIEVNASGEIQYLKNEFYQDTGCSFNEVVAVNTAVYFRNCYDSRRWRIEVNTVATDTASNTWTRSPGSAEGVAMIEYMMEKIAFMTGKDSTSVRLANMSKENNPLPEMIEELKTTSEYDARHTEIAKFNNENRWRKRALKIQPIATPIFYLGNYNSIVSIYHADGTVSITHGGIEMGQGLNTKAAQVCAHILGIPIENISVKPSTSLTSPNCVVTGGSIGSECVVFATMKACETLMERLKPIKQKSVNNSWEEIIADAFNEGIELQASHMYSVNKDGLSTYVVYAVCALEVEIDVLTGNHDIRRVDLLEDTGRSLSPIIDISQIEGAFVMGLGYWTSENLIYEPETGRLLTDRTWTYKPPGLKDIPADMRVYLRRNMRNDLGVLQSKATGEPALCLASVVAHALREAVRAARLHAGMADQWFDIENPCTVENVFMAIENKIEDYLLK